MSDANGDEPPPAERRHAYEQPYYPPGYQPPLYPPTQVFPLNQPPPLGPAYQPPQDYRPARSYAPGAPPAAGPPPSGPLPPAPPYGPQYPQYPGYPSYPHGYAQEYAASAFAFTPPPVAPPSSRRPKPVNPVGLIVAGTVLVIALVVGGVLLAQHHSSSGPPVALDTPGPTSFQTLPGGPGGSGLPSAGFPTAGAQPPGGFGSSGPSSGAPAAGGGPTCDQLAANAVFDNELQAQAGGSAPPGIPTPGGTAVTTCTGTFDDGTDDEITIIAYDGASKAGYDETLNQAGWVADDEGAYTIYSDDGSSGYQLVTFVDYGALVVVFDGA